MRTLWRTTVPAIAAASLLATPAHAVVPMELSAGAAVRSGATPLVYVFVIDGADGDEYENGRLPFIKGLVDKRGTYYAESRAIMVAETNPNHTAMITGAYADTSGIPANDFAMYGNGASSAEDAATSMPRSPVPRTRLNSALCQRWRSCLISNGQPSASASARSWLCSPAR